MPLIDISYFQFPINIPNTDKPAISGGLTVLINMLEPQLLIHLMGSYMYDAFKTGIAAQTPEQRWIDLRDGKIYTYNSKQYKWKGLKETNGTSKNSIIALYVYYYHLRDKATLTTGTGEQTAKPEAGSAVDSISKQCLAWNLMVDWGKELYQFLRAEETTYPEWQKTYWIDLTKINSLGI